MSLIFRPQDDKFKEGGVRGCGYDIGSGLLCGRGGGFCIGGPGGGGLSSGLLSGGWLGGRVLGLGFGCIGLLRSAVRGGDGGFDLCGGLYIGIPFVQVVASPSDEDKGGDEPEKEDALADVVGGGGFIFSGGFLEGLRSGLFFFGDVLQPGGCVFPGGEVELAVVVLDKGADAFDIEGFAYVEELFACSEIEVQVSCGQGFHFSRVVLDELDQGVVRGSDGGVFKGNARSGCLHVAVASFRDHGGRVERKAANTREVELLGLVEELRQ